MKQVGSWIRGRLGVASSYALCAVLFVIGAIHSPGFASASNIRQMLVFASFVGFAALGQTLVIIAGGLDLTVPWLMAFGGIELSRLAAGGMPAVPAIALVVAIGAIIGLINGVGVTWLRIAPIVMTLAMGGLVQAFLLAVGELQSTGDQVPAVAVHLASNRVGPFPVVAIVWLGFAVAAGIVLSRSAFGRRLYAVGANDTVAWLSGVNVALIRILTYTISGAMTTFGGVVLAGYVGTTYLDIGGPYLFTSIAAVIIGGASILGGSGSYWGTVAGALTLTVLSSLLPLFQLSNAGLEIVYGVVILIGVWLASTGHRLLGRLWRRGLALPDNMQGGAGDVSA
ncbi:MAG: ABC transporter permease [Actinomycetota bacterium]|nr:ABC transporter permease [Actinomycetota bacterium]